MLGNDFRQSWQFDMDADPIWDERHAVEVGSVADACEIPAACIFDTKYPSHGPCQ
jgi:hypothetical protein